MATEKRDPSITISRKAHKVFKDIVHTVEQGNGRFTLKDLFNFMADKKDVITKLLAKRI